jgi:hypothetical protein
VQDLSRALHVLARGYKARTDPCPPRPRAHRSRHPWSLVDPLHAPASIDRSPSVGHAPIWAYPILDPLGYLCHSAFQGKLHHTESRSAVSMRSTSTLPAWLTAARIAFTGTFSA